MSLDRVVAPGPLPAPKEARSRPAEATPAPDREQTATPSPGACACGASCPRCAASNGPPALTIADAQGAPEREADQAADRLLTRSAGAAENAPIEKKPSTASSPAPSDNIAPASVHSTLGESGSPLPADLNAGFSKKMGRDLSPVRVHTGANAGRSAQDVDADAYTVGNHIVFAPGQYAPSTGSGQHLLAHELSHVGQQQNASPQVQRRPRGKRETSAADLLASVVDALQEQQQKMLRERYVRSIIGDFVRSDRYIDSSFNRTVKTEKYKDSSLTTETYFILVEQKTDDKEATKPYALIVDRHTTFNLHGKYEGSLHARDHARLSDSAKGKQASQLTKAKAYEVSDPETTVRFEKPTTSFVPVRPKPSKAGSYAAQMAKHPLFDLSATPKERVTALEKLIPGYQPQPDALPPATTAPKPPVKKTPQPETVETPEEVEVYDPSARKTDEDVDVAQPVKPAPEEKKEKEEDHWYDGLLRALGVLAMGLTILMGVALVVAGIYFLATGVVLTATAALAIAGTALLIWGIYTAVRARSSQKEYQGRPGATFLRSLADAVGITGMQEAYTGRDAGTGRKLTDGERAERGTLGGINFFALLWGARGSFRGGGKPGAPTTVEPAPIAPETVPTKPPVAPDIAPTPPVAPDVVPTTPDVVPNTPPVAPDVVPVEPPTTVPRIKPGDPAVPPPERLPDTHPPAPTPAAPDLPPQEPVPVAPDQTPARPGVPDTVPDPMPPETVPGEPQPQTPKTPPDKTPTTPDTDVPDAGKPRTRKRRAKDPDQPKPSDKDEPTKKNTKTRNTRAKPPPEDPQRGVKDGLERIKKSIADDYADIAKLTKKKAAAAEKARIAREKLDATAKNDPQRGALEAKAKAAWAKVVELNEQIASRGNEIAWKAKLRDRYTAALNAKTYARPTDYDAGLRQKVWDDAVASSPDGKVRSPGGAELQFGDDWVMGHKPGFEFWKHQESAARRGISRDAFIREHNQARKYRPETDADNSSHAYEAADNIYYGD